MKYIHKAILSDTIKNLLLNNKEKKILNKTIIDCTAGEGGHSHALLSVMHNSTLILIDRDKNILNIAKKRLSPIKKTNTLIFENKNFSEIKTIIKNNNINNPDLIFYDLGISMYHYKISKKGFSFLDNYKLDMRLDQNNNIDAYTIINSFTKEQIRQLLLTFGEEYNAKKIANSIINARKNKKIETAQELANIIKQAKNKEIYKKNKIHPATKSFQALRIFINNELFHITKSLIDAIYILDKNSKIAVITFHSIEDRLVKRIFKYFQQNCSCPNKQPICNCIAKASIKNLNKKPITPNNIEKENNPPSRSSKLRIIEKIIEKIYEETKTNKEKILKTKKLYNNAKKIFYPPNYPYNTSTY